MDNSSFWEITVPRIMSSYAVSIFVILWLGLAIVLIVNPAWLSTLWNWVGDLPPVLRIPAWVFITPVMTALWIWESSWTMIVRVLAFSGIAGWTALAASSFIRAFR
jgi:hypothetical protein